MSGHQKLSPDTGWFEPLRSLGHAAVLANYAAVGTAIEHPTRVFILSNFTDRDVVMSIDGIDDYFLLPAGTEYVQDTAADGFSLPKGTIFYAKRYNAGIAPTVGVVTVSIFYSILE